MNNKHLIEIHNSNISIDYRSWCQKSATWWRCHFLVCQTVSLFYSDFSICEIFELKFSNFLYASHQKTLKRIFFNDPDIESKLDFSKPINFIIHGWLSGLLQEGDLHADGKIANENDGM